VAREYQYKKQFKRWNLNKNVTTKEMEAIVRIQKRRQENEMKATQFSFGGKPVPPNKIDRWQRRHKTAGEEAASPNPGSAG